MDLLKDPEECQTPAPMEISLNKTKGFSISVGNIVIRFMKNDSQYELLSNCRFLSRVERVGNVDNLWKMLSIKVIYINEKISPVFTTLESNDWSVEKIAEFPRKSSRFLAYCLAEKGFQVKRDLPGMDDEHLVAEVFNRNLSWLKE